MLWQGHQTLREIARVVGMLSATQHAILLITHYYILRELCVTLVFYLLHKYYRYYKYSHSSPRYADASGNQGREGVTVVDSRGMEITQPWYLALLNLLVVHPWYSWGLKTLLTDPFSNPHPTCGSRPATISCLEFQEKTWQRDKYYITEYMEAML